MAKKKGMYSVIEGIAQLASELGVTILTNQNVEKIITEKQSHWYSCKWRK